MTALGPGVRVKCIQDNWVSSWGGTDGPTVGTVWTVAEVDTYDDGAVLFSLVEWISGEDFFFSEYFVPLDGNEDISVFTSILDKLPEKHKEPATV